MRCTGKVARPSAGLTRQKNLHINTPLARVNILANSGVGGGEFRSIQKTVRIMAQQKEKMLNIPLFYPIFIFFGRFQTLLSDNNENFGASLILFFF